MKKELLPEQKKKRKKGLFEEANGRHYFLDEIGEIPHGTQTKLLRVLQEKEIVKSWRHKVNNIDVRIIAANKCRFRKAIESGRFRADLYYRLNVLPINNTAFKAEKR